MYDVIIIGMGISGVSASLYAKKSGLNVLLLEGSMPGGLLNNIDVIHNYAGLSNIKGNDFSMNLLKQVNDESIDYKLEKVISIEKEDNLFYVNTTSNKYTAKNVIVATGRKAMLLNLPNEEKLFGRGISVCATCDGYFYKDKIVAVYGNNINAVNEALYLSNICSKVYFITKRKSLDENSTNKLINKNNIEIIYDNNIIEINDKDEIMNSIKLENDNTLNIDGLFIYMGYKPNNDLVKEFNISNDKNYIEVNQNYETKVKGLYAIGDVIDKEVYQLITAANDGAKVINSILDNN